MARPTKPDPRRALPAVESLLRHPTIEAAALELPRAVLTDAIRAELAALRSRKQTATPEAIAAGAERRARAAATPQLRRVLNATGVVLHTNLGRAPFAAAAQRAIAEAASGYSSLEFDLDSGKRGERGTGVTRWLTRLTGAEDALAVNNGAGALLLALSAVAEGKAVVVSRGELVEIGGSFRIPDVMRKSGARLIEVGTTNRTHLRDYERAFAKDKDIAALLRVHRSNFRIEGFTTRPELRDLAKLARKHRIPLIEDLGSGALLDLASIGLPHEPTVSESLKAGVSLVTASGDKLLGGAQAGLILGARKHVERARKDPLARALRLDKLALAGLEATLALYADPASATENIPALAMLRATPEQIEPRARRLAAELTKRIPDLRTRIVKADGEVGGGALPLVKLPGFAVEVEHPKHSAAELERRARAGAPPIIGTTRAGKWRLDPRTLTDAEIPELAASLDAALRG